MYFLKFFFYFTVVRYFIRMPFLAMTAIFVLFFIKSAEFPRKEKLRFFLGHSSEYRINIISFGFSG